MVLLVQRSPTIAVTTTSSVQPPAISVEPRLARSLPLPATATLSLIFFLTFSILLHTPAGLIASDAHHASENRIS